jgi:hypothetical protein
MNTKGVNFQPSKRGQFSAAVDIGEGGDFVVRLAQPRSSPAGEKGSERH